MGPGKGAYVAGFCGAAGEDHGDRFAARAIYEIVLRGGGAQLTLLKGDEASGSGERERNGREAHDGGQGISELHSGELLGGNLALQKLDLMKIVPIQSIKSYASDILLRQRPKQNQVHDIRDSPTAPDLGLTIGISDTTSEDKIHSSLCYTLSTDSYGRVGIAAACIQKAMCFAASSRVMCLPFYEDTVTVMLLLAEPLCLISGLKNCGRHLFAQY